MNRRRVYGERLLRAAMFCHPSRFRRAYANEMVDYYRAALREGWGRGAGWRTVFLLRSVWSAIATGVAQRFGRETGSGWSILEGGVSGRDGDGSRAADARGGRGPLPGGPPMKPGMATRLEGVWLDVRQATRTLAKQPRFSFTVVAVLALGMGANTAMFGVLSAVLLDPLPYAEPDRLVRLYQVRTDQPFALNYATAPAFVDIRSQVGSFSDIAALYSYAETGVDVTRTDGSPERIRALGVSADYFGVLGIALTRGRSFERSHERSGSRVVVLSASAAERLGGAVGQRIELDGIPQEIIGITPAGFEDPVVGPVDVWLPLTFQESDWQEWQWGNHYLTLIARLAPGVTQARAQEEVAARFLVYREQVPSSDLETGQLVPLHDDIVGGADSLLMLLMGAVGFLLLVACVNVAGLFTARGAARSRELAVRAALGSPRRRIVRQLVFESVLLAGAGGLAGLVLGRAMSRGLVGLAPPELIPAAGVHFDLDVFGFSFAVATLAGVLFGLVPAFLLTSANLDQSLREGGRAGGQSRGEGRARSVLVVTQLALSLVLLVGAGLLIRSFDALGRADLGFAPQHVMTFQVNLPAVRYDAAGRARFHNELLRRIAGLPGVRAAGAVSHLPTTGSFLSWGVDRGAGVEDGQSDAQANQRTVEGDYFEALGIPVVAGRTFGPQDDAEAEPRVVLSEALASALFPAGDAVGSQITVNGTRTVIGVVGDVAIGARGQTAPMVYHSHTQFAANRNWALSYVVATTGSAPGVLDAVRQELAVMDPGIVMFRPAQLADIVGRGVAQERFAMTLMAAFGLVALLLAAVGVYGVLAYGVNRRRQEIGVRIALGANAAAVRRSVVWRGLRLALIGSVIGAAGAFVLTSMLSVLLFGIGARDPVSFIAAVMALSVVVVAASWLPARTATRVDPVMVLRD